MNRSAFLKSIALVRAPDHCNREASLMPAASKSGRRRNIMTWTLAALAAAVLAPIAPALWRQLQRAEFRPHAPDWALFAALPLQVQIHVTAAFTALAIGAVILARPKGRGLHKALGWSWVAAMMTTALSSLFITGLNGDFYSMVHLLSGWTLVALPLAIFAIRHRDVDAHRRVTGLFIGGLLIAGALTFIPGRFMFEFLFG